MVPDLIQLGVRQPQARREFDPPLLAVDRGFNSAMADVDEGEELVDGEEVGDAVAELRRHMAGIICKCLGGVARLPAASVLQRLRQIPVIERRKRFYAGFEQRIDEPAGEVETLCVGLTGAVAKSP